MNIYVFVITKKFVLTEFAINSVYCVFIGCSLSVSV